MQDSIKLAQTGIFKKSVYTLLGTQPQGAIIFSFFEEK